MQWLQSKCFLIESKSTLIVTFATIYLIILKKSTLIVTIATIYLILHKKHFDCNLCNHLFNIFNNRRSRYEKSQIPSWNFDSYPTKSEASDRKSDNLCVIMYLYYIKQYITCIVINNYHHLPWIFRILAWISSIYWRWVFSFM